jgi:hypothetical protein
MNYAQQQAVIRAYANELSLQARFPANQAQPQIPTFLPSLISDPRSLTPVKLS